MNRSFVDAVASGDSRQLRSYFRWKLRYGYWFHHVKWWVKDVHRRFSVGYWFKRWIAAGDVPTPPGSSELYQAAIFIISLIWAGIVRTPTIPALSSIPARILGCLLLGYWLIELAFFLLDWVFVPGLPIEDYRRSLGTLIAASMAVALQFTTLYSLGGCQKYRYSALGTAYNNWQDLVRLDVVHLGKSWHCPILAQSQWLFGLLLVGVIISSLLGPIVRPERQGTVPTTKA